ncbi:MAG TPA: hypothetical protein VIA62_19445 [Thermoanaerobaculia bacterium]|jgi:hypothetical protein|nr:hypothetical protein [Thermoanaerobaculia bacterium]
MRDSEDPNTAPPRNAFAEEFLNRFEQEDEPPAAAEADVAGPWEVQPFPLADGREAFGLWRLGERPDLGDAPAGLFRDHATALLAGTVRPFVGRDPFYELGRERESNGFPLLRQGEAVGWLDLFDEDWAMGLNVLERLTRSPQALATLMEAAGPLALERAGRILRARVMEREE